MLEVGRSSNIHRALGKPLLSDGLCCHDLVFLFSFHTMSEENHHGMLLMLGYNRKSAIWCGYRSVSSNSSVTKLASTSLSSANRLLGRWRGAWRDDHPSPAGELSLPRWARINLYRVPHKGFVFTERKCSAPVVPRRICS